MSRSHKKHCGLSFVCYRSDKPWRKQWHSAMRARERDLLNLQMKCPEEDFCYPVPREAGDIYDAPSDGGSCWMYSGFEHDYCERARPRWYWWSLLPEKVPSREEVWKEWVTEMVGK
jgi:hypothetical protein